MQKLTAGDIAIIDYLKFSQPKKIEVLEETETTYLLHDLDFEKYRDFIVDTEYIANNNIDVKKIMEDFSNQNVVFNSQPLIPSIQPISAKFRITKEEFEKTYKVIEMVKTMVQRIEDEKRHGDMLKALFKDKKD